MTDKTQSIQPDAAFYGQAADIRQAVELLRSKGYAVCLFVPADIPEGVADPAAALAEVVPALEDVLAQRGNEFLSDHFSSANDGA